MSNEEQIVLTPEGLEKVKREMSDLKIKRKEVAGRIESAKALGDLSENAEYQDAKEESAWVEGRILELSNILSRAVVVNNPSNEIVTVGKKVMVENEEGQRIFNIVGANEADPIHGKISSGSPLGMAFLGKRVDDEMEVQTPGGVKYYKIISIE
ncbi:MAG: transcription elongation factor GreA [bacterium]|nr:transcription elongation factor GreA [bacterium]